MAPPPKSQRAQSNPYQTQAGERTDQLIYKEFFGEHDFPHPPPFSEEETAAELLKKQIESVYRCKVVTGKTRTRPSLFFARFDDGPSTSTETLAETYPLALARLALVLLSRRDRPRP